MSEEEGGVIRKSKSGAIILYKKDSHYGREQRILVQAPEDPEEEHKPAKGEQPRILKNLEAQKLDVNAEIMVGQRRMVTKETKREETGDFYCDVCDVIMKDNLAWLDHINGTKRKTNDNKVNLDNRALGMSMVVAKVGVDKVKEKLSKLSKSKTSEPVKSMEDFEKKYEDDLKRKAEERSKDDKKKKKLKIQNEIIEAQIDEYEAEMAQTMGLPVSFGSTKKSK